jgi:hypothetical protein
MSQPQHESLIGLLCLIIILLTVFVYQNTQNNKLIQTALFPKVVTNLSDTDPGLAGHGIVNITSATYNTTKNIVTNPDGTLCPEECVNQMTGAKITLKNGMACPAPYPAGMTYNATTKKCVKTSTR